MEIFKIIEEFPKYEISNLGNVRNIKGINMITGKRMSNSGYLQIRLYYNNKYYYRYIHRLVAKAFIPNPNNYRTINHINGNKLDNTISNLEWASDAQQQRHAFLNSLKPFGKSFTNEQLNEIYTMFFIKNFKPRKISTILNRPFGTVRKICYGERCKDCRDKFLENTEIK